MFLSRVVLIRTVFVVVLVGVLSLFGCSAEPAYVELLDTGIDVNTDIGIDVGNGLGADASGGAEVGMDTDEDSGPGRDVGVSAGGGLHLRGGVVSAGDMMIGERYTLSGELSQSMRQGVSRSGRFALKHSAPAVVLNQ